MGRHLTLDNSSTKHLMHVANKHLGDDAVCEVEVPPRTPLPPTGPDDTEGNCWERVEYENANIRFSEYQEPCQDEENQPTTCYGDYFPCVWKMVIEGVNPLNNYYGLTGECGFGHKFIHTTETITTGSYECVGCEGANGPSLWHHLPTDHEYQTLIGGDPARTRPTANINGNYIVSLDQGDHGGDYGWSKHGTHLTSHPLVILKKDGVTDETTPGSHQGWYLTAYMFFRSCAGGFNYGYRTYKESNPTLYNMKDGAHLFLLFGGNSGSMDGIVRKGSPYSGFASDCGYHRANVFAGHLSNVHCSGTNQFINEFDGEYNHEDNLPSQGVSQLKQVVIPYYAGGSITLYPMPDSFYEE